MNYWTTTLLAFALNGITLLGMKLISKMGLIGSLPQILIVMYCAALALSVMHFLNSRTRFSLLSAIVGLIAGVGNAASVYASIRAAAILPGYVAFPLCSIGAIVVVSVCGMLFFHERIGRFGLAGLACGIVAVILLSGR